jgi:hypothetical protein
MTLETPPGGAKSESSRLAPLADLALLAAVAAGAAFVIVALAVAPGWPGILLGMGGGAAIVALVGRKALGAHVSPQVAVGTGLALVIGCIGSMAVLFGTCRALEQPWAPFVGGGAVYVVLGLWSLRKRFLWGLPLAIVLAFATGITLFLTLAGTATVCD